MKVEILPEGALKRVHVNRHVIASNRVHGRMEPVFTVKHKGKTHIAGAVQGEGSFAFIYSPNKPLPCGALAWLETHAALVLMTGPLLLDGDGLGEGNSIVVGDEEIPICAATFAD